MIDRSLLCHAQREAFIRKNDKRFSGPENVLVRILRKDGMVFSACVQYARLDWNKIDGGDHDGLLWWPEELL